MHRKIDFKIAIQMIAVLLVHFSSLNIHLLIVRSAGYYILVTNVIPHLSI